jgi:hypothetical protein
MHRFLFARRIHPHDLPRPGEPSGPSACRAAAAACSRKSGGAVLLHASNMEISGVDAGCR